MEGKAFIEVRDEVREPLVLSGEFDESRQDDATHELRGKGHVLSHRCQG